MSASSRALPALAGDHEYSGHFARAIMDSSEAAQVDPGYLIGTYLSFYLGRAAHLVVGLIGRSVAMC